MSATPTRLKLFGQDTIWGIDANNTPTVEDPWNTTPAWGWPQISSTIAPAFAPPLTHVESGYGQIVGGAGLYIFWNDMLYADFTAYKGLPVPVLQAFNDGNSTTDALTNVAPYWRVALEPHRGSHYLMVGTFGMYGQITPGRQYGFGTDNFLDVGVDSQYQYDGDQYSVTVKLTDIMEWQKLNATYALAGASNINNTLNSFKANASFVWDHTYSLGFGYFNVSGSRRLQHIRVAGGAVPAKRPGAFHNSFSGKPKRRRPDPRPRLYPVRSRRAGTLRLQDLERPHRHSVHRATCISTAARTISTARFSAARITRPGNNSVFAYAWLAFYAGPREPRPSRNRKRRETGESMSATACWFRKGRTNKLPGVIALACGALIAAGSQALALKIPIQATLTGGGEVPPNDSPAKGLMQGTFDTDTNTLDWTVTYSGLRGPIGAHFHGPVSYLGLTPEENAPIQVGTPGNLASPFHGEAKIDDHPGQGPQGWTLLLQPSLDKNSRRRNSRTRRPPIGVLGSVDAAWL